MVEFDGAHWHEGHDDYDLEKTRSRLRSKGHLREGGYKRNKVP